MPAATFPPSADVLRATAQQLTEALGQLQQALDPAQGRAVSPEAMQQIATGLQQAQAALQSAQAALTPPALAKKPAKPTAAVPGLNELAAMSAYSKVSAIQRVAKDLHATEQPLGSRGPLSRADVERVQAERDALLSRR